MKLLCWLETLWNEIRYLAPISGHQYGPSHKNEVFFDRVVLVKYCSRCGEPEISHTSRENYELWKAQGKI